MDDEDFAVSADRGLYEQFYRPGGLANFQLPEYDSLREFVLGNQYSRQPHLRGAAQQAQEVSLRNTRQSPDWDSWRKDAALRAQQTVITPEELSREILPGPDVKMAEPSPNDAVRDALAGRNLGRRSPVQTAPSGTVRRTSAPIRAVRAPAKPQGGLRQGSTVRAVKPDVRATKQQVPLKPAPVPETPAPELKKPLPSKNTLDDYMDRLGDY
jgi:hypothetical protein